MDQTNEINEGMDAIGYDDQTEGCDAADEDNSEAGYDADVSPQPDELSDEELDKVADTTIETLRQILTFFDAEDCTIDEYEGDDGELIFDVVGENLAVLIGHYGKTLDALQYLVASIVNKKIGFRYPIVVDIEGYRNRRRQKLETLAKSSAARCIRTKKEVRLRPMTPYERRIIHIILRDERRVFTESEGEDPQRQIVIKPR
jgi:spoIIIJ-associated protein